MAPTAFTFSPEHVHTDNAVMLLMGKHILEKGEFPIFYYGQNWFGSLSALVHAGVFLALGGIPSWSIHVAPLLFFLGFCLVLYLLTRMTLGPAVALVALAWNIVTPVPLSEYTVMPHGGYIEGLMLAPSCSGWPCACPGKGASEEHRPLCLAGIRGRSRMVDQSSRDLPDPRRGRLCRSERAALAIWKGAVLSMPTFFISAPRSSTSTPADPYSTF